MGDKMRTVFSIVFAAVFAALVLTMWTRSTSILKTQTATINRIYDAEYGFDMTLFDNTLVSGRTINNLKAFIDKTPDLSGITLEPTVISSSDISSAYRSKIEYSNNGTIKKIKFTKE